MTKLVVLYVFSIMMNGETLTERRVMKDMVECGHMKHRLEFTFRPPSNMLVQGYSCEYWEGKVG